LTEISFEDSFLVLKTRLTPEREEVSLFASLDHVREGLCATGYFADPIAATTVYLATKLSKPLLPKGPAGSGKTD
jgi:MoxR-like ATPase